MSLKPKVSVDEIRKALDEALRRRAECSDFRVNKIIRCSDGPSNWDAEIVYEKSESIAAECKRVMLATKLGIQNRFDLAD